jgi:hypothetical protein
MTYDTETVVARYQNMLDLPDGEPTETACALMRQGGAALDSLGCEPEGCRSCCVGVAELVRQFGEQAAALDPRSVEIPEIRTSAEKATHGGDSPRVDAGSAGQIVTTSD